MCVSTIWLLIYFILPQTDADTAREVKKKVSEVECYHTQGSKKMLRTNLLKFLYNHLKMPCKCGEIIYPEFKVHLRAMMYFD